MCYIDLPVFSILKVEPMNKRRNEGQKKQRALWWKIPLGLLLLLFVGLAVAILNINSIARYQINQALERFLTEGGTLDAIDIQLKEGRVKFAGLTINPPQGYGTYPLLSLDSVELDVDPISLFGDEIVVEQLALKGLSLILVRDKQGQLNLIKLVPPAEEASEPPKPNDNSEEQKQLSIPAIRVNSIRFENLSVRLMDHLAGEQWSAGLRLDLAVDNLQLRDLFNQEIMVGNVNLSLSKIKVDQPKGFSRMPLLAVDKIELATPGFDLGSSRLPVSKVLLDKLVASVERNQSGVTSLQWLLDRWVPAASDVDQQGKTGVKLSSASEKPAAAADFPTLVFKDIQLKSIAMQLLDSVDGEPWRAGFDGLDIKVTGLKVGDIAQQAISLDSFTLDLRGAAVDQPPGFDTEKLASLERFAVTTGGLDLASPELVIKQVQIQGVAASVIMRAGGLSNLERLNETLFGKAEEKAQPEVETDVSTSENVLPVICFEQIIMEGGSLSYRDEALTEETVLFPLGNIRLEVTKLRLFDDNAEADPASASVSFELGQPGNLPTAYLGSVAVIGPVSSGVPSVNSQVRLTGFKLDTLGSLVPQATRDLLGASGLDADLALALHNDRIKLKASVLSDENIQYDAIKVKGPLDAPKVEVGKVLAGVYSRVSDGLLNLGKDGLSAGVGIAEGGLGAVGKVGSGALKIGKNIGKNLFKTGAGLVTRDRQQLREGLVGSTKGSADLAMDSVEGAGSAAGGGLKGSVSDLKGDTALRAWDEDIPARYQTAMQQAQEALVKMHYPPVTD